MKRKTFKIMLDDTVPANQSEATVSPVLPAGKWAQINEYGGSSSSLGDSFTVQYGSNAAGWTTIRAWYHQGNFTKERELIGDGNSKIRLVRQNSTAESKPIFMWCEVTIDEVE